MTPNAGGAPAARTVFPLFLALLLATLGAFALTRALRAQDDIVNAVEIDGSAGAGKSATIRFTLVDGDDSADLLIVDRGGLTVRSLLVDEALSAGPHQLSWDGLDDDGSAVAPGNYELRVVLDGQDRDIRPAGRVTVRAGPG